MRETALSWVKWVTNTLKWLIINWKVVAPIGLFLGSSVGLSFSMVSDAESEKIKAIREVAIGFQNAAIKPAEPVESCNCSLILGNHIKKDH